MTPNGRVLRTIEAGVARPLGASFSGNSRPNADAHIESLYRACCYLVPFGRSGNRGSKHSALRGLVYVCRGRCGLCRADNCCCNCDGAVIALSEQLSQPIAHSGKPLLFIRPGTSNSPLQTCIDQFEIKHGNRLRSARSAINEHSCARAIAALVRSRFRATQLDGNPESHRLAGCLPVLRLRLA
jgi:hypothetical protein